MAQRTTWLIGRGLLWLLLLGPLFFASYGFSNWLATQRDDVSSLVFEWENEIPLWPWTILPYWSIDLLYGLSFLLPTTRHEMDRHAFRLASAQLICVTCFLLWPLRFTFERPELEGVFGWLFEVLMGFDKPFNQAPSLHITLLVIIWALFARHIRGRYLRLAMHLWMALIGLSVLTTWQHHFIDVPTGVLAGWLCVWLWPLEGDAPLRKMRLARDPKRWRLALYYILGAAGFAALASLGGNWLWCFWPCTSLLLVALNYALFNAEGFQKKADGRLSSAATWLLVPYLAAAWLNSRLWTHRHPQADEIRDGVYLGRLPDRKQAESFAAIVDLCAELPITTRPDQYYRGLPSLDLVTPDPEWCRQAAIAIEQARGQGPVLVCCALGYSRSAIAVAAWLLHSGHCRTVRQAWERIRRARPRIVLHSAHLRTLEGLAHEH
ncbi:phosphatase PAP2/dual specificity phosphatase family protein [Zestomonas carbonaria]|uniref:Tyrosine specific protein phosphatases domain-containing protein n=1 Tax=Zestomonas carbonaria TaxID=2762745 RepID=A0A7U7I8V9_9GAMM|nr:phosphatase PAP2/dual specificity phosphatase family protein [Pseudomonas carbonaria]CAD5107076.1 putative protein YnbD [Pseudomonas carbonaria]